MSKRLNMDSEIVADYSKTLSAYKTAERLGINWKSVYDALARQGVSRNGLFHYRKNAQRHSDAVEIEILRRYEAGERSLKLAQEFGGTQGTIINVVVRRGGKPRIISGKACIVSTDQERDICKKYSEGMSLVS